MNMIKKDKGEVALLEACVHELLQNWFEIVSENIGAVYNNIKKAAKGPCAFGKCTHIPKDVAGSSRDIRDVLVPTPAALLFHTGANQKKITPLLVPKPASELFRKRAEAIPDKEGAPTKRRRHNAVLPQDKATSGRKHWSNISEKPVKSVGEHGEVYWRVMRANGYVKDPKTGRAVESSPHSNVHRQMENLDFPTNASGYRGRKRAHEMGLDTCTGRVRKKNEGDSPVAASLKACSSTSRTGRGGSRT